MKWNLTKRARKRAEWKRWFAWYPVEIFDEINGKYQLRVVWLEYVERRFYGYRNTYPEYRFIKKE